MSSLARSVQRSSDMPSAQTQDQPAAKVRLQSSRGDGKVVRQLAQKCGLNLPVQSATPQSSRYVAQPVVCILEHLQAGISPFNLRFASTTQFCLTRQQTKAISRGGRRPRATTLRTADARKPGWPCCSSPGKRAPAAVQGLHDGGRGSTGSTSRVPRPVRYRAEELPCLGTMVPRGWVRRASTARSRGFSRFETYLRH